MAQDTIEKRGSGRIHGLDALRGVLMMLGVVLHTLLAYLPNRPAAFRDPGPAATWGVFVVDAIHLFRMPAFFLISGFFGALLWQRRGARAMLKNRAERVALPLGAFVFLLWPAVGFAHVFALGVVDGTPVPWARAVEKLTWSAALPANLFHLWFLYYLVLISLVTVAVVALLNRRSLAWPWLLDSVRAAAEKPWRSIGFFGLLNGLWCVLMQWDGIPTSASWLPSPSILTYYLGCYGLGWMLYASKMDLSTLKDRAWTFVAIGSGCVVVRSMVPSWGGQAAGAGGWLPPPELILGHGVRVAATSVALVAFSRGFAGVFVRHASSGAYGWRYLSDASYWVYLVHLPLAAVIPALLVGWKVHVLVKSVVAMLLVAGICFATYDLGVRATFVGRFLNGRRYPRYSVTLSALVSLFGVVAIGHAVATVPPPSKRPTPWIGGADPQTLLPGERLIVPLTPKRAAPPKISMAHCIGVRRYAVCPDAASFEEAGAACLALGGELTVLEAASENAAVAELLSKLMQRPFWIALSDRQEEGTWRWSNAAKLRYSSWKKDEPNNSRGEEDCAVSNWRKTGEWNDVSCRGRFGYVCEFETELKPEQ